ncbi:TetR/AcrR family transcriptional regulator [Nocardioides speluncae]|uniref:TetR/AcrR family transcriptional regulator n=1 Tax=Nocardioides speluncae TaxID=2670337 RepID=UPI00137B127B|nr:TetR/AcrR family transcriptional regulator [Nocardioides speluncae]
MTETGIRQRTRKAILDGALSVWARDFTATLHDIADAAEVSRSTLHRYFPDRQSLVDAAKDAAIAALEESGVRAVSSGSDAADQLDAMLRATVDVGNAVIFLFFDPNRFADIWEGDDAEDAHSELREIVTRAQADGAVAADVAPDWVINMFYAVVYTAAESVNDGALPRHRAGEVASRTFFGGLGAR